MARSLPIAGSWGASLAALLEKELKEIASGSPLVYWKTKGELIESQNHTSRLLLAQKVGRE